MKPVIPASVPGDAGRAALLLRGWFWCLLEDLDQWAGSFRWISGYCSLLSQVCIQSPTPNFCRVVASSASPLPRQLFFHWKKSTSTLLFFFCSCLQSGAGRWANRTGQHTWNISSVQQQEVLVLVAQVAAKADLLFVPPIFQYFLKSFSNRSAFNLSYKSLPMTNFLKLF